MAQHRRSPQQLIASLMPEDVGAVQYQGRDPLGQTATSTVGTSAYGTGTSAGGFTARELKIAKKFIELMGGVERARDAVDRCGECLDCLGLVDDGRPDDTASVIAKMAEFVPNVPDLPTRNLNTSMLYGRTV